MKIKTRYITFLIVLLLTTLACGQLDFGIEEASPNIPDQAVQDAVSDSENQTEQIEQTENAAARDETERENFSGYWKEVADNRTGLRFAIPCFWVADLPPQQNNFAGLGSYSVNNFTQDFVSSLGLKQSETIWQIGGKKFDLSYLTLNEFSLSPNASLEELAYALINPDSEHGIESTKSVEVNGRQALRVNSWSTFGTGSFYLVPFTNDLIIMFAPFPGDVVDHPDVQAILQSMALDPGAQVQLPTQKPAGPPEGMAAPCMGDFVSDETSADDSITGTMDCNQVTEAESLMWVICNVQASFISRNTQPLLGTMGEPFKIGYWQSEGVELSRMQALSELESSHIPPDTSALTFTTDRTQFPPLFGMQPEQIFPPDANIVEVLYSEGWGPSGQGAAFLYFAEAANGKYYFYGMLIAMGHFDK